MEINQQFEKMAKEWETHCRKTAFSSRIEDYLNCPAFHQLVSLGPKVVPLIMEEFSLEQMIPWEFVLQEVTGNKMIENPGNYAPEEVRQNWLHWWKEQKSSDNNK